MTGSRDSNPGPLVDVHAHFLPQTLTAALRARSEPPMIVDTADGTFVDYGHGYLEPFGKTAGRELSDLLQSMDSHGVTVSIISINQPGVIGMPAAEAAAVARAANDELLDQVASSDGRLAGLATLPLQDPQAAVAELQRVVGAGLSGAIILSNVNGAFISAPQFDPIFAAAEELDAALLLHPIQPVAADMFRRPNDLTVALGFLYDTTLAATQLVLGGLYDRYPRIRFVLCHAGSLLPQLAGRIDLEAERNPAVRGRLSVMPSEHIKLIYTDTVAGWPTAVRAALSLFGEARVMFGSDFPFWDQGQATAVLSDLVESGDCPPGLAAHTAIEVFRLERTPAAVTDQVAG